MAGNLSNNQIFISKVTEIILANLGDENFGVNELAHELGIRHQILRRRLRAITNKNIKQLIREIRLNKALELLKNESFTASEVAYKVGFSSPAYFNTCFHEFFGYPPGQVIKVTLNNADEPAAVLVTQKPERKRSVRRPYVILSFAFVFIAVLVVLYFFVFARESSHDDVDTVLDIDGNVYRAVSIGTQVWMGEDLRTTRYNDGTSIPYVTDTAEWASLYSDAFCWANNEDSNKTIYGALYNWYTTNTGKLCPVGWHVSTSDDWEILVDYCGGWEIAGGKLKETGTVHWDAPNVGATDEFGFTAIPAGGRGCNGKFSILRRDLGYWCPPRCGDFRSLCSDRAWIYLTESVACEACCVRCVKDQKTRK
jgi:uncharacterized protein (TIGR02145 family)